MTKFKATLIRNHPEDLSRTVATPDGRPIFLAKSITSYFFHDGQGNCLFSVEGWKEREIRAAGFEEE